MPRKASGTSRPLPSANESSEQIMQTTKKKKEKSLKLTLVGDGMVGKSTLMIRYLDPDRLENLLRRGRTLATVVESQVCKLRVKEEEVSVEIMDTAGQDAYEQIRLSCYKDTDIFVFCYSVDMKSSLENVKELWHKEVKQYSFLNKKTTVVLCGTKTDLLLDTRRSRNFEVVSEREGEELAKKIGAQAHIRCSSISGENVSLIFQQAIKIGLKKKYKSGCIVM
eukprot:maker-scaffold_43-snap-gene-1.34-mRNA-1 protein AED:0.03 eAED:0.03 QI:56/1/1/1/1/1/4/79/222